MKLLVNGLFEFIVQQLKFRNLIFLVIPLCLLALLFFGRADSESGNTATSNSSANQPIENAQQVIISDDAYAGSADENDNVETNTQLAEQSSSGEQGTQSNSGAVLAPQPAIEINQAQAGSPTGGNSLEPAVRLLDTIGADQASDAQALDDAIALEIDRIVIPSINLDTAVTKLGWHTNTDEAGQIFSEWDFANNAAGWHKNSARPGEGGNVVMSGHNNILGAVFRELDQLDQGDEAFVYVGDQVFTYEIERVMVVPEVYADAEQQAANAQWIEQFADDRLTLVSCWPRDDNSHRIIVIGHAVER